MSTISYVSCQGAINKHITNNKICFPSIYLIFPIKNPSYMNGHSQTHWRNIKMCRVDVRMPVKYFFLNHVVKIKKLLLIVSGVPCVSSAIDMLTIAWLIWRYAYHCMIGIMICLPLHDWYNDMLNIAWLV